MKIIAKKPCNFNGIKYFVGEEIPESSVKDPKSQEVMGVVSLVPEGDHVGEFADMVSQVGEVHFLVPILKGEESMELPVSETQIAEAAKTLQMSQKDAVAHIKDHVEDNTVLIILNACDSRAAVKKEAETKAKSLAGLEESAGDA